MGASKRQLIVVSVLGVVFVGLAIYRLRGMSDGPAVAEASHSGAVVVDVVVGADVQPQQVLDELSTSDDVREWLLPAPDSLTDRLAVDWPRPRHNPFLVSDALRGVIDGRVTQDETPQEDRDERVASGPIEPPFGIRSTFEILGRWHAEIGDRTHVVGDVVDGFEILEIDARRVRLAWLGTEGTVSPSGDVKPTSVVLTCRHSAGLVGASWIRAGDRAFGGEVVMVGPDGVVVETQAGEERGGEQRRSTIEVGVDRGS